MLFPEIRPAARHPLRALGLLSCALLSACGSPPTALPDTPRLPAAYAAAPVASAAPAEPSAPEAAPATPVRWWRLFQDSELDALQERLVVGNESLQRLAAQVRLAQAQLQTSGASLLPALNANAGFTRADTDTQSGRAGNNASVGVAATWEVDLWGRLAQSRDAAQSRVVASELDLAAARLSAQATLTQLHLSLRAARAQEDLLSRTLAVYQRSLNLAEVRFQGGVVSQTDVLQAQTQLKLTEIQLAEARTQQAQLRHAIAGLLGTTPGEVALAPTASLPTPPKVPPLIPADLLRRRPDVAAVQARLQAALRQVGASESALLPALTLQGNIGWRGGEWAHLITQPHQVWSLGASLVQAIFDGGVKRSIVAQSKAEADAAASNFRQSVLNAVIEVEDNLALSGELAHQIRLQQETVQLAQRNLQITEDQYRVGTVSYVNVVLAQATALNTERSLIDLRARHLQATNLLLRNAAGSW